MIGLRRNFYGRKPGSRCTIGREPDHTASGPLQELIKLREGRLAGGLERSDRIKRAGIAAGPKGYTVCLEAEPRSKLALE